MEYEYLTSNEENTFS